MPDPQNYQVMITELADASAGTLRPTLLKVGLTHIQPTPHLTWFPMCVGCIQTEVKKGEQKWSKKKGSTRVHPRVPKANTVPDRPAVPCGLDAGPSPIREIMCEMWSTPCSVRITFQL
jgi:hypothetical protein